MKFRLSHRRRQIYPEAGEGGLTLTGLGDIAIHGKLGEGVTCAVYDATWKERDVILKLYKAGSIERHHRLLGEEIVEFEWRRNKAFYEADGLAPYVAEPLAYRTGPGLAAFVQEKLEGKLYFDHHEDRGELDEPLFEHVKTIVRLSHAAGLYDVDLHAGNLMVVREPDGTLRPKLFDFNFIPFYIHPPNPFVAMGLKLGILDRSWRDLRKLERFHDFTRFRRKLDKFGEVEAESKVES